MASKKKEKKGKEKSSQARLVDLLRNNAVWEWSGTTVNCLPALPLVRCKNAPLKIIGSCCGPENDEEGSTHSLGNIACGQAMSTYPKQSGKRLGTPICDRYSFVVSDIYTVFCIADGCSWGPAPLKAAKYAVENIVNHVTGSICEQMTVRNAGELLLEAVEVAHENILRSSDKLSFDAGTTTALGGIIAPLASLTEVSGTSSGGSSFKRVLSFGKKKDKDEDKKGKGKDASAAELEAPDATIGWVCILVTVGDCKAFHWRNEARELTDITLTSRLSDLDPTDPGGRIGPYRDGKMPDLRNLHVCACRCGQDDLIILASDGVYDNMDPWMLGRTPGSCDKSLSGFVTWEDAFKSEPEIARRVRDSLQYAQFQDVVAKSERDPSTLAGALVQHCWDVTELGRQFLEKNPNKRLPSDHALYPGKMDHSTAVVIRVCHFGHSLGSTHQSN